jgi:hypothetical protein
VEVLLHVRHLAAALLLLALFGKVRLILGLPLLLREVAPPLDLSEFFFFGLDRVALAPQPL